MQVATNLRRIAFASAFTLLAGCFPASQLSSVAARETSIKDARVTSIIEQEEIVIRPIDPKPKTSPLWSSFRDKFSRRPTRSVNSGGDPEAIRTAVGNIDVRQELAQELANNLERGSPFPVVSIDSRRQTKSTATEQLASQAEDGLIVLRANYFFTPDLRAFRVETHVAMYAKSVTDTSAKGRKSKDSGRPFFENQIIIHTEIPAQDSANAFDYWTRDQGANAIDVMRQSLRETARLLVWELNDTEQKLASGKLQTWTLLEGSDQNAVQVKGTLVLETVKRQIIRLDNGNLLSIPNTKREAALRGPRSASIE